MENRRLEDIESLELVFVDSNILTYHLLSDPVFGDSCREFIGRVESGGIRGFVSPVVVSETIFNFIKAWIAEKKGVSVGSVVKHIKNNPKVVREVDLSKPRRLFNLFNVLPVTEDVLFLSLDLVSKFSLLPSDGLHAAVMQFYGIRVLASNDSDFEGLKGIKLYRPSEKKVEE